MYRVGTSDERGASSVEYGLIVFAIAATVVVIIFALGQLTQSMYSDSCDKVAQKAAPSTTCK